MKAPLRKKKKRTKLEAQPDKRAHIVWPASKLDAAKRGEPVQARCGAPVTGDPIPDAPVCQACVVAQLKVDDQASSEEVSKRFVEGQEEGRRRHAVELRTYAAETARAERARLEEPRFELIDNDTAIRFQLDDGTTATVRRDRIASVLLEQQGDVYRVVVDGRVLVAHTDGELVRRHYDRLHGAVFGGRVPAGQASNS